MKIIAEQYGAYPAGRLQDLHSGILKVMKAISAAPLLSCTTRAYFANGFLTERLELVYHAPEYGMTYCLQRNMPEKAGHTPTCDQFLDEFWAAGLEYGDKLSALQEMLGVALMGKATQCAERRLILWKKLQSIDHI